MGALSMLAAFDLLLFLVRSVQPVSDGARPATSRAAMNHLNVVETSRAPEEKRAMIGNKMGQGEARKEATVDRGVRQAKSKSDPSSIVAWIIAILGIAVSG